MAAHFKRVTLLVPDAAASAAFWQAVLGLREWYRDEFAVDARFPPAAPDGSRARLIVLAESGGTDGCVGFLEYVDNAPASPAPAARVAPGQPVLAFRCDDAFAIATRAREAGALAVTGPGRWQVPARDGGAVTLETVGVFDPNGVYAEASARVDPP